MTDAQRKKLACMILNDPEIRQLLREIMRKSQTTKTKEFLSFF